jgi:hypothetical protein
MNIKFDDFHIIGLEQELNRVEQNGSCDGWTYISHPKKAMIKAVPTETTKFIHIKYLLHWVGKLVKVSSGGTNLKKLVLSFKA